MSSSVWHERHPEEFERVRKSIEDEFPYLYFCSRYERTVVTGTLPVVENGNVTATYEIELILHEDGPRAGIPLVREIGGRIPHDPDRHNPGGFACLMVTEEFWYRHPEGMDLVDFLRGPVTSFFVSQTYFDRHGKWPFDERSHGAVGLLEFWAEIAGTKDLIIIRGYLDAVSSRSYKRRRYCPCRSGLRVQDCHSEQIQLLRKRIPRELAARLRSAL